MNGHDRASPWHEGERRLQASVGVEARMEQVGQRVIRDYLPDQHRDFYRRLPFIVLGSVDPSGDAWATLIAGEPGFVSTPDAKTLSIASTRDPTDPAWSGLGPSSAVGLLGIELHTRRRNRMNGNVIAIDAGRVAVRVEHSFGNCPQYIQTRITELARDPSDPYAGVVEELAGFDDAARAQIAAADTFFVASYVDGVGAEPQRQVDVSHRGGKPGFVRVGAEGVLTIPDFAGNLHFNTLGNFLLNPRAGLVFADFASGDLLQLTGTAAVITDSPEIAAFQGAERLWTFRPSRIVRRRAALPLRAALGDYSPNSLMTGSWEEAAARIEAAALRRTWRPFHVTRIVDESATIRSFVLQPADGRGLPRHAAGQHLPIRLNLPGRSQPQRRTYTLSVAPSDGCYRISVKRDGLASQFLHQQVSVGDLIEARAPAGNFTIDAAAHGPAVLLAGGVGITPMLAMLRHIVYEGARTRRTRPTWLFHAARTLAERGFDREIDALVAQAGGAVRVIRVLSQPETGAQAGRDFDHRGHLGLQLLTDTLPFDDCEFFLCGPPPFMQSLYDELRKRRVPDDRIHAESFGPGGVERRDGAAFALRPRRAPAISPVPVAFVRSAKEARWQPGAGTLLELAEERGLTPEFACRAGVCGTCRTPVLEGRVSYLLEPALEVGEAEALICCSVPAAGDSREPQRLVLDL